MSSQEPDFCEPAAKRQRKEESPPQAPLSSLPEPPTSSIESRGSEEEGTTSRFFRIPAEEEVQFGVQKAEKKQRQSQDEELQADNCKLEHIPKLKGVTSSLLSTPKMETAEELITLTETDGDPEDGLDTDTKLAILASLVPEKGYTHEELLDALVEAGGRVERAEELLQQREAVKGKEFHTSSKEGGKIGSLGFFSPQKKLTSMKKESRCKLGSNINSAPVTPSHSRTSTAPSPTRTVGPISTTTTTATPVIASTQSFLTKFLPSSSTSNITGESTISLPIPKPQKGKPLLLFYPYHIAALTPCTLVTNFFPSILAEELLREMVTAAEDFPEKGSEETRFRMFGGGKEVYSHHTSGFFVRENAGVQPPEREKTRENARGVGKVEEDWKGGDGYLYNGIRASHRNVKPFTTAMEKATSLVEQKIREIIHARWKKEGGRRKYESPLPWSTNAAFVNCYEGGGEFVGWHADQLTYLGPMSTIASVSLGVGREFGLKKEEGKGAGKGDGGDGGGEEGGVIKIWLPHNSLLVMEAGTQEGWKHCIYPSHAISRHPISGNKRINITYRCYRPSLAPRYTPRCRCPLPGVLRTVMDRKSPNCGRYFWHCQGGYHGKGDKGEGCGWFEWAEWDEDGEVKGWRERKEEEENAVEDTYSGKGRKELGK